VTKFSMKNWLRTPLEGVFCCETLKFCVCATTHCPNVVICCRTLDLLLYLILIESYSILHPYPCCSVESAAAPRSIAPPPRCRHRGRLQRPAAARHADQRRRPPPRTGRLGHRRASHPHRRNGRPWRPAPPCRCAGRPELPHASDWPPLWCRSRDRLRNPRHRAAPRTDYGALLHTRADRAPSRKRTTSPQGPAMAPRSSVSLRRAAVAALCAGLP
jgi:hypothetical protein